MNRFFPGFDGVWHLRPDLEMIESTAPDGSPSLLVHDPVGETFDRVDWPEADLVRLLRRPATIAELGERFSRLNPLRPSPMDVAAYLNHLAGKGWLQKPRVWPRRFAPRPKAGFAATVARMLFFQIPLARPEHFLRATGGLARLWLNGFVIALFAVIGLAGLYLALPRWEEFWRTVASSATLAGAPGFLAALIAVKVAHEFAHAYVATGCGARVKTMGVALFFFMPLPFTDVTDGWRLPWPERLRVASAGLLAELCVGASALFLWALSPPGAMAATLARLATVAVVSTLATNLNPGPRFDGYFILVCLMRMENLRVRGVTALRGLVWRVFFGIDSASEENLRGGKKLSLYAYAAYALFYRIGLGFALVALAYAMFPKAIGLPVAALEMYLLFLAPVARECVFLWSRRAAMRFTFGTGLLVLFLAGAGVWFFGDWPRRLAFPAVTRAEVEEAVRARREGVVAKIYATRGEKVAAGQVLAVLESPVDPFILERAEWALREAEIGEAQSWTGGAARRDSPSREAERKRRADELAAYRRQAEMLTIESPAAGVLAAWDESFEPGVAVRRGGLLGRIVEGGARRLSCYPEVETARRFAPGAEAFFLPDSGGPWKRGTVFSVAPASIEKVDDEELARALNAVWTGGEWRIPGAPRVKVTVVLDEPFDRVGQTGTVRVRSRPESLAARAAAWLRNLAVRESAF